ncbi:hypothetical protein TY_47 [Pseudomonas phage vB_PaeM_Ty]|nr:hypothetical protein TY_47 [Pseudomonas phage vB_PaeM_Ty]
MAKYRIIRGRQAFTYYVQRKLWWLPIWRTMKKPTFFAIQTPYIFGTVGEAEEFCKRCLSLEKQKPRQVVKYVETN